MTGVFTLMNKFLPALIVGLTLLSTAIAGPGPITYSATLSSSTYSSVSNTTTFTYSVSSNPAGGPAISHWVLGLTGECAGANAIAASSDPLTEWSRPDPTTGLTGVKFDTGYDDGETRTVMLTLKGNWATGPVTIAVKAGNGFVNGTVQGPICSAAVPPATYTVSGTVFFDANYNGSLNADEPGLGSFSVALVNAVGANIATKTTASNGVYSFTGVLAGDYYVIVTHNVPGIASTTLTEHAIKVVNANLTAPVTGYAINFASLSGMTAGGYTIGFWKNNLEKAIVGKTNGVQLSASTLSTYTSSVSTAIPLEPFAALTMSSAASTLSANGPAPTLLLAKQLLASEYNYANRAYLNGDATLTYLFIYQGEYVLKNSANYSASYILWLKDWFDAYNNTHGGALIGPAL